MAARVVLPRIRHFCLLVMTVVIGSAPAAWAQTPQLSREYIRLGDRIIAIENAASALSLSPGDNLTVPAQGVSATFNISTTASWTLANNAPGWIAASPASGTGNAVVNYTVSPHAGPDSRTGKLTVTLAGTSVAREFTITQLAPGGLQPASGPVELGDGSGAATRYFDVLNSTGWTAVSDAAWLVLAPPDPAQPNRVFYTVAPFDQASCQGVRTSQIRITGGTTPITAAFTVTQYQKPCIQPSSVILPPANGSGQFTVYGSTGWTPTPSGGWIAITGINSADGSEFAKTVSYTVTGDGTNRSGTIMLNGGSPPFEPSKSAFTITQQGECVVPTLAVNPASIQVNADRTNTVGPLTVTTNSSWKVETSNPQGLFIRPNAGSGNTQAEYLVYNTLNGNTINYTATFSTTGATCSGQQAQATLNVSVPPARIFIQPANLTIYAGQSYQLYAFVNGSMSNGTVSWSTTLGSVYSGLYTAPAYIYSTTMAYVTATIPGSPTSATVTVTIRPNAQYLVPTNDSVTPNSGTGGNQSFRFQASSWGGYGRISSMNLLFSNPKLPLTDQRNACVMQTSPQFGASSSVALYSDDPFNDPMGTHAGFYGERSTLENSQCAVDLSSSSVSGYGNSLSVNLAMSFKQAFHGGHGIYMQANDYLYGMNAVSNLGSWTVNSAVNQAPKVPELTPVLGSGTETFFRIQATDPNGTKDLLYVEMLITPSNSGAGICYLHYRVDTNNFYLANDANDTWMGPYQAQDHTVVASNSQCEISMPRVYVRTTLDFDVRVTFRNRDAAGNPAFTGAKSISVQAADKAGASSGWHVLGGWTIPLPSLPPSAESVTPNAGTGTSQLFTAVYSDPNGAGEIQLGEVVFNNILYGSNACWIRYDRPSNQLYLINDAGTDYVPGSLTPGGSGTLENTQCSVDASGSVISTAGNTLRVGIPLSFKPGFQGAKNVYSQGYDLAGLASGWQNLGAWNVPELSAGDFNGDGKADLIWQNDNTRQVAVNYHDGATLIGSNWLHASGEPGWHVTAASDFDGNGVPDLVWQNDSTRQVTANYYGGSQGDSLIGWSWLDENGEQPWRVAGAADFDGDGVPDLIWQNEDTRDVRVWLMGGSGGATQQARSFPIQRGRDGVCWQGSEPLQSFSCLWPSNALGTPFEGGCK